LDVAYWEVRCEFAENAFLFLVLWVDEELIMTVVFYGRVVCRLPSAKTYWIASLLLRSLFRVENDVVKQGGKRRRKNGKAKTL